MNKPREQIAVALFNLLSGITWAGSPATGGGFATTARTGRMWTDVPDVAQPAMFLFQVGEHGTQRQTIGLYKWEMKFWCLIYLRADASAADAGTTVETQMDALLDAFEKALQPVTGEKQTLGGLVNNAWIEGEIVIDPGILDQQCAIIIPLVVQTGS